MCSTDLAPQTEMIAFTIYKKITINNLRSYDHSILTVACCELQLTVRLGPRSNLRAKVKESKSRWGAGVARLVLRHRELSPHLPRWHPILECQFKSWLFCFQMSSLLMHWGTVNDGPSTCTLATHIGGLDDVPAPGFSLVQPWLLLSLAKWIRRWKSSRSWDLSLSSTFFEAPSNAILKKKKKREIPTRWPEAWGIEWYNLHHLVATGTHDTLLDVFILQKTTRIKTLRCLQSLKKKNGLGKKQKQKHNTMTCH